MADPELILYFDVDERIGVEPVRPSPLQTEFSHPNVVEGKPYIAHDWRKKRALMETGYIVQPNDCPPIRNICSYGFEFYASGLSKVTRHDRRLPRKTLPDSATNGFFTHSGASCSGTDSGFLTSWLANSEYIKVVTGVIVHCPVGYGLYQGGIPYRSDSALVALPAIEFGNSLGTCSIRGEKYFSVELNLVCSLSVDEVTIDRGHPLGVVYPMLPSRRVRLENLGAHEKPIRA